MTLSWISDKELELKSRFTIRILYVFGIVTISGIFLQSLGVMVNAYSLFGDNICHYNWTRGNIWIETCQKDWFRGLTLP